MNTDLTKNAQQFVGIMDGKLVCHTGVIQAPLRKGFKQVHRLVVLPDYQGIGIGTQFITFIAHHYNMENFTLKLITTTPAIRFSLDRSNRWKLTRSGKVQPAGKTDYMKHWVNSESSNRVTYTYVYETPYGVCTCCDQTMNSGYMINDGEEFYCSDDCLHGWYSEEEYDELCQEGKVKIFNNVVS